MNPINSINSINSINFHKPKGGFTLVEVIIVTAIIALLAAIAIPNLMKAREGSDIAACRANQRIITEAVIACMVKESLAIPAADVTLDKANVWVSGAYDPIGLGYMAATDPYSPSDPAPGGVGYTITIATSTGRVSITAGGL